MGAITILQKLLLTRDADLTRSLAGTGVGAGTLTANGQTAAMTHAAIGAEVDQTLDGKLDFTAKVAFNGELRNGITNLFEFGVVEILDLLGKLDAAGSKDFLSTRAADTVDRGETDDGVLIRRNINTGDTSHVVFTSISLDAACDADLRRSPAQHPCA